MLVKSLWETKAAVQTQTWLASLDWEGGRGSKIELANLRPTLLYSTPPPIQTDPMGLKQKVKVVAGWF